MGILNWILLSLSDLGTSKEPKSDDGVALQVINNYRTSQRMAQEDDDSEEVAREQEAEEFTADQVVKEQQRNDRIALEVYTIENQVTHRSREEDAELPSPTAGFDTWLADQSKGLPPDTDLSSAMKDYILHPEPEPEPSDDYERS